MVSWKTSHVGDDFTRSLISRGARTNRPFTAVFTRLHLELAEGTLNGGTGAPRVDLTGT